MTSLRERQRERETVKLLSQQGDPQKVNGSIIKSDVALKNIVSVIRTRTSYIDMIFYFFVVSAVSSSSCIFDGDAYRYLYDQIVPMYLNGAALALQPLFIEPCRLLLSQPTLIRMLYHI